MTENQDDIFSALLGGDVKPLVAEKRVPVEKKKESKAKDVSQSVRRKAAIDAKVDDLDPLSSEPVDMVSPMALLSYSRPGVQHGVFKSLRLGRYAIDARLDLHRLTVDEARVTLYGFVKDCLENDIRAALITHGKGEGREKPALLKSCVAYWLPQIEDVLAFHTAQKHHGSYGATYVLLKKSKSKKTENRELFSYKKSR